MELEEIFAEIKNLTTGIYYKQLKELVNSISEIPHKERNKYSIVCQENIFAQCKKIADYFNIKTIKPAYLPDDILIFLYKEEFLGGILSERKNKKNNRKN